MGEGKAVIVAAIRASTVASRSGVGVGVGSGSAADTAACTVAPKSGEGVGVATGATTGLSPAQATVSSREKHRVVETRIFIAQLLLYAMTLRGFL